MKSPTLGNDDLSYIANGCEGDTVKNCPFDFTFIEDRILKANTRVGYVLSIRACLKSKHVRQNLWKEKKNDQIEDVNE